MNKVPDPITDQGEIALDTSLEAMLNFSDEDLGPGGPFVTRWGADPIRKAPVSDGWFMPREAFLDDNGHLTGELVRDVPMPVPAGEKKDPDEGGAARPPISTETLRVSLLAFEPRFDLDSETWYVDVPINPMSMAYPFVRLGIVRYQQHAAPELRVSEPSVVDFQLMPKRSVEVDIAVTEAGGQRVDLVMRGRASIRSAPLPEDARQHRRTPEDPKLQQRHRPTVRASVLRPVLGHPNAPVGEEVARSPGGQELSWDSSISLADQPVEGEGGLVWRHSFDLEAPEGVTSGLSLFMEEIEQMLPSSYEPSKRPSKDNQHTPAELEDTGPRFAVRIPLDFGP